MYAQTVPVETVHDFFKQQRTVNFQNYLALKKEEKEAVRRYNAAVKIQQVFRGWLVRCNFKLIQASAIKIQALWRRAIARMKYAVMYKNHMEKKRQEMLNKMATRIQAAWRGFLSRKNYLNFKEYKKLQAKNLELEKSIEKMNVLEEILSSEHIEEMIRESVSTIIQGHSSNHSSVLSLLSENEKSLDELLSNSMDRLSRMSSDRISELFTYALQSTHSKPGIFPGASSKNINALGTSPSQEGKESLDQDQDQNVGQGKFQKKLIAIRDSLVEMFPNLPDDVDLVRPDPEKAELLKEAIKLLRRHIEERELQKLYRQHHLMRTVAIPGVYSDIYSDELTEMEKKLKGLRFLKTNIERESEQRNYQVCPESEPQIYMEEKWNYDYMNILREKVIGLGNGVGRASPSVSENSFVSGMDQDGQYSANENFASFYGGEPETTNFPMPSSPDSDSRIPYTSY